jgi:hypothetical protein
MEIIEQIGAYAGLASIVGLAILSALYFSQARDVKRLREWAGRAPERAGEAVPGQPPVPGRVVAQPQQPPAAAAPPPVPSAPAPRPASAAGARGGPSSAPATAPAAAAGARPAAATAAAQENQPAAGKPGAGSAAGAPAPLPATAAAGPATAAAANAPSQAQTPKQAAPSAETGQAAPDGAEPVAATRTKPASEDAAATRTEPVEDGTAATRPKPAEGPAAATGTKPAEGPAAATGTKPAERAAPPAPGGPPAPSRPASPATPAASTANPPPQDAPAKPSPAAVAGNAVKRPGAAAPPRPSARPAARPGAAVRPSPLPTEVIAPPGRPWYRRLGDNPLYLVLAIVGVLIVGGGAVFGALQLTGDDGGTSEPQPREAAPAEQPQEQANQEGRRRRAGGIDPGTVTVAVLNGTTVQGLAAQLADRVESSGFNIGTIANGSDQTRAESVVLFSPGKEREAAAVSRRLGIAQREPVDPASQGLAGDATVVVVAGSDKTQ